MKNLSDYEIRSVNADGIESRKYMVFPNEGDNLLAGNREALCRIAQDIFTEGLFRGDSVFENETEGWRLILSYKDKDISDSFHPFNIADADSENAARIVDDVLGHLGKPVCFIDQFRRSDNTGRQRLSEDPFPEGGFAVFSEDCDALRPAIARSVVSWKDPEGGMRYGIDVYAGPGLQNHIGSAVWEDPDNSEEDVETIVENVLSMFRRVMEVWNSEDIVWDGKNSTLERIRRRYDLEYDVREEDGEVYVTWYKTACYSKGDAIPDLSPAGS